MQPLRRGNQFAGRGLVKRSREKKPRHTPSGCCTRLCPPPRARCFAVPWELLASALLASCCPCTVRFPGRPRLHAQVAPPPPWEGFCSSEKAKELVKWGGCEAGAQGLCLAWTWLHRTKVDGCVCVQRRCFSLSLPSSGNISVPGDTFPCLRLMEFP